MTEFVARVRGELFRLFCKYFKKNIDIAEGLRIYKGFTLEGRGKVWIGKNCVVAGIRGDRSQYVCIDTHDPEAVIRIGDDVHLFAARITARFEIVIGNKVLIEETGILDTDFHALDVSRQLPLGENRTNCRIRIGNNVSVGAKSIITKGVSVGDNAIVGPGSVVKSSIPAGSIVFGNPARVVKAVVSAPKEAS